MTFYSSGRMFRTDWFRFYIEVDDGRIVRLNPTNVPARRVRVLENRKGPERRREMAQDVTAGMAGASIQQPDNFATYLDQENLRERSATDQAQG